MKAELTADGVLIISPQGDVEMYALRQWHKNWPGDSKLAIVTKDDDYGRNRSAVQIEPLER